VAERDEPGVALDGREPTKPSAGHVLEEDALDGVVGAVAEDLVAARLDEVRHALDPAR
jgi:hypothetical protein